MTWAVPRWRWFVVPAIAAGAALLAGCAAGGSPTDATSGHNQAPNSLPSGASASATPEAPSGGCAAGALRVTLGQGGAAAGHFYVPVVFTNTSSTPCTISGYPQVVYVSAPHGAQVGDPATDVAGHAAPVRLAPGAAASALVEETDVDVYPAAACGPTSVPGLRVSPPESDSPAFVAQPNARACAKHMPGQSQLRVRPVVPGTTGT